MIYLLQKVRMTKRIENKILSVNSKGMNFIKSYYILLVGIIKKKWKLFFDRKQAYLDKFNEKF